MAGKEIQTEEGLSDALDMAAHVVKDNLGPQWLVYYIGVRILGLEPVFIAKHFGVNRRSVTRAVSRVDYRMGFWREEDEWNEKWNIISEFQSRYNRARAAEERQRRLR